MKRSIPITISLIFALLCSTIILLWARSHQVMDLVIMSGSGGRYYELVTIPGQLRITRVTNWTGHQSLRWYGSDVPPRWPVFGQQAVYRTWVPPGIAFDGGTRKISLPTSGAVANRPFAVGYQIIAVPFAVPALFTGIIALLPWLRFRSRRRLRQTRVAHGLCPACGYDLRASLARCPECGYTNPI
jgi:hypothetical protein